MMSSTDVASFVEEFRSRAEEIEQHRSLPRDLFERLARQGAFRLLLPTELGGLGSTLRELYVVVRTLATGDPSAAWVVGQGAVFLGATAVRLTQDFVDEALVDPLANFAGSGIPNGTAVAVAGGYRISGRWPWATGSGNATWLAGLALVEAPGAGGPAPMLCFAPAEEATVEDDWDALGMRGTGSGHFSFDDVFVPARRMCPMGAPAIRSDLPLGALVKGTWHIALAASAVLVGCARLAIREVEQLLSDGKSLLMAGSSHRESAVVQRSFAQSELALDAADQFAEGALEESWAVGASGRSPTPLERARVHAALSHAAQVAATVTDAMGDIATGDAIARGTPLERCLRDARTHRMHASIYPATFERVGRVRLGVLDDDPFL